MVDMGWCVSLNLNGKRCFYGNDMACGVLPLFQELKVLFVVKYGSGAVCIKKAGCSVMEDLAEKLAEVKHPYHDKFGAAAELEDDAHDSELQKFENTAGVESSVCADAPFANHFPRGTRMTVQGAAVCSTASELGSGAE